MSGQTELPFLDGVRAAEQYAELLKGFDSELIAGMRLKAAAKLLGIKEGTLRNKLDGKAGGVLHAREFFLLLFAGSHSQARGTVERIARSHNCITVDIETLTPEQKLERTRDKLSRLGELGAQLIEELGL